MAANAQWAGSFGPSNDLLDQFEELKIVKVAQVDFPGISLFIDLHEDAHQDAFFVLPVLTIIEPTQRSYSDLPPEKMQTPKEIEQQK